MDVGTRKTNIIQLGIAPILFNAQINGSACILQRIKTSQMSPDLFAKQIDFRAAEIRQIIAVFAVTHWKTDISSTES